MHAFTHLSVPHTYFISESMQTFWEKEDSRKKERKKEREKNAIYSGHLLFCLQPKGSACTPLGPQSMYCFQQPIKLAQLTCIIFSQLISIDSKIKHSTIMFVCKPIYWSEVKLFDSMRKKTSYHCIQRIPIDGRQDIEYQDRILNHFKTATFKSLFKPI